jgi:uncharacterized protein (DUF736 family)
MAQIGQFTRGKCGFSGRIRTLAITCGLTLVPAEASDAENAPDYRAHLGDGEGPEIGAGWKRTGQKDGEYASVVIDDPTLTQPIRANLFRSGGDRSAWVLNWTRPARRSERD